jgi:hypothetical protein
MAAAEDVTLSNLKSSQRFEVRWRRCVCCAWLTRGLAGVYCRPSARQASHGHSLCVLLVCACVRVRACVPSCGWCCVVVGEKTAEKLEKSQFTKAKQLLAQFILLGSDVRVLALPVTRVASHSSARVVAAQVELFMDWFKDITENVAPSSTRRVAMSIAEYERQWI